MGKQALYEHIKHWYQQPRNPNQIQAEEQNAAGFNQRLAVTITRMTGTMWCAYAFAALALIGLFGILGWLSPIAVVLVTWISQTFLQLVFLPVLSVGQATLGKHAEIQADEAFSTTQRSYHDIGQVMAHLDAQDQAILEILRRLDAQEKHVDNIVK